jgi:hypothetical protein
LTPLCFPSSFSLISHHTLFRMTFHFRSKGSVETTWAVGTVTRSFQGSDDYLLLVFEELTWGCPA